jgi:3-methyl-2-oxobutanoate hydroxymethyltransferase
MSDQDVEGRPEFRKKISLGTLRTLKSRGIPASFITAYDYPSACFVDAAGVDMILVGDSAGMTMLGYKNTLAVTMDDMILFSKAVCRGNKTAFVIGDMPFLSYQISNEDAVKNAGRFVAEAGCDAVKLEGGERMVQRIQAIADAGIAVMAHLGLTPQSISLAGGYRVYGKTLEEFESLLKDALAVEKAGASFILVESLPEESAGWIRDAVKIPVYGIGAGRRVDGQLLILHDVIGAFVGEIKPKFVKRYASVGAAITSAVRGFSSEVKSGQFPDDSHQYAFEPRERQRIVEKFSF